MKKIVILSMIAPAILGLSACGNKTTSVDNTTVSNVDDANLTAMDDNSSDVIDNNLSDNATTANAL